MERIPEFQRFGEPLPDEPVAVPIETEVIKVPRNTPESGEFNTRPEISPDATINSAPRATETAEGIY